MKISDEFPSTYVKASDLGGREIRVTMVNVEREKIGTDTKLVLYFKDAQKGLVLNKTNAYTIGDAYGEDTEDWYGQPLILFSVKTDYQGKVVNATRCRIPTAKDKREAEQRRTERQRPPADDPITSGPQGNAPDANAYAQAHGKTPQANQLNDDIPF